MSVIQILAILMNNKDIDKVRNKVYYRSSGNELITIRSLSSLKQDAKKIVWDNWYSIV